MKRALLMTHGPLPPRDYVSQCLGELGYAREWRCLPKGHVLPAPDPKIYDLVVVYGGPQLLTDLKPEEAFLLDEMAWVKTFVEAGGTYLGLCLGAQILAKALGAKVYRHPEGRREVGVYPIQATQEGKNQLGLPADMQVYHWHRDGFEMPEGATAMATGTAFPNQAYTLGERVLAVQFHPEITEAMIANWAERASGEHDTALGAQPRATHLSAYRPHKDQVQGWIKAWLQQL